MNAPLVFGLDYCGPRLATGPGAVTVQLNYVPSCLKAPIRPPLLATHFPISPGFPSGYCFLPKPVLEPVLCRREDETRHVPIFPSGDTQPLSRAFLSAGFSLHSYASPSVRLKDGQEDPHIREVRENPPAQPLLRSKLLVVSCPSS